MGQQALGILYGCECPALPNDSGSEEPDYDLIDRWEKSQKIDYSSRDRQRLRIEHEGGKRLIGVWVAVGGSGEDGVPYLADQCMPLDQIEDAFGKQTKAAKKLWDKFAVWCAKKEAVAMPKAKLWLTPCEVA